MNQSKRDTEKTFGVIKEAAVHSCGSGLALTCLVGARYVSGHQHQEALQAGGGPAMLGNGSGAFCLRALGTRMAR